MDTSRVIGIAAAALMILLAGCGGGGSGGSPSMGAVALQITDGPFFDDENPCIVEAWIAVEGVSVKSADGVFTELTLAEPTTDEHQGAVKMNGDVLEVNLMALTNGVLADLAAGALPTGTYSEIRLLVGDTWLVFDESIDTSGTPESQTVFKVPSGSSSGLKIKIDPPFVVAAQQTTHLDLDFSLAKSFHTAGLGGTPSCDDFLAGQGKVLYAPSIRAINNDDSGVLDGFVWAEQADAPPEAVAQFAAMVGQPGVSVWAVPTAGGDAVPTVTEGENSDWGVGYFAFLLEEGEYDLYLEDPTSEGATPAVSGVVVLAGQVTSENLTVPAPAEVTTE